jgi:hypothetical protein
VNRSETARLLATISSFNNRTIGEGDVIAWQSVLADVELPDAEEAVRRHFAENTEWVMPAHVRRLVRDIIRERESAASLWAPGQYGVLKDQAVPELPRGERLTAGDISPRVVELLSQLRAELPEAPRETLFPRQVAWERLQMARRRAATAAPNPHYRPGAVADLLGDLPAPTAVRGGIRFGSVPDDTVPLTDDDRLRTACRSMAAHDSGLHIADCPDDVSPDANCRNPWHDLETGDHPEKCPGCGAVD